VDLSLTDSEAAFKDEVRSWLEENHPGPAPEGDDAAGLVGPLGHELDGGHGWSSRSEDWCCRCSIGGVAGPGST
jgi:hypothetical protein